MSKKAKRYIKLTIYLLLATSWMALIFYCSSRPLDTLDLGGINVGKSALFRKYLQYPVHFGVFYILSIFVSFAVRITRRSISKLRACLLVFTITMLFALSDEIHQAFVPTRSLALRDIVMNTAGAASGTFTIWLLLNRSRDRESERAALLESHEES